MAKSPYCEIICRRKGCLGNLCPLEEGSKNSGPRATTGDDETQEAAIHAWQNGLSEKEIQELYRRRKIEG